MIPPSGAAEITLGFALAELGKLDEAETHHRLALRLNPNNAQAHCNLGMILGRKGRQVLSGETKPIIGR